MTLTLGQLTYNGVLIGPGGVAQVVNIDGLTGAADNRTNDVSRPHDSGLLAGYDYQGGRTVNLALQVMTTTSASMQQNLAAVRAAFLQQTIGYGGINSPATQQLVFNLGETDGVGNGVNRFVTARCRKTDVTADVGFTAGVAQVAVSLTAVDPLIYDTVLQTASTGLRNQVGGLTFPFTFRYNFGSQTGGLITVANAGSAPVAPYVTITGPCTYPRVENQTTGQSVELTVTLASTDVLVLDFYNRAATLNGVSSQLNQLVSGSTWFTIPPGGATVAFYSSDVSATAALMTFQTRNGWA